MNVYTLVYLKWIPNEDLHIAQGNLLIVMSCHAWMTALLT